MVSSSPYLYQLLFQLYLVSYGKLEDSSSSQTHFDREKRRPDAVAVLWNAVQQCLMIEPDGFKNISRITSIAKASFLTSDLIKQPSADRMSINTANMLDTCKHLRIKIVVTVRGASREKEIRLFAFVCLFCTKICNSANEWSFLLRDSKVAVCLSEPLNLFWRILVYRRDRSHRPWRRTFRENKTWGDNAISLKRSAKVSNNVINPWFKGYSKTKCKNVMGIYMTYYECDKLQ